jgi:hypothetical protein
LYFTHAPLRSPLSYLLSARFAITPSRPARFAAATSSLAVASKIDDNRTGSRMRFNA